MPTLRLFRGDDPLESDTIPFPRSRRADERTPLRLTESLHPAEEAIERVQRQLDEARSLVAGRWWDDDGPRAA